MDSTPLNQHAKILGDYNALSTLGFVVGPMIGGHIGETPLGKTLLYMTVAFIFIFQAGGFYIIQHVCNVQCTFLFISFCLITYGWTNSRIRCLQLINSALDLSIFEITSVVL